jgi:uncharacterized protein (TIRG00374 family)
MTLKRTLTILMGIAFSAVGLYLAFRNVPVSSLLSYLSTVNYLWIFPATVALATAYILRSLRWQWLLRPAGHVNLPNAYHSLIISMMINCLLPGRVGELARPMILKQQERIPVATSLASLGIERLLDLIILLILLIPALITAAPPADATIKFADYQLNRALLVHLGWLSLGTVLALAFFAYLVGHQGLRRRCLNRLEQLPVLFGRMRLNKARAILARAVPHAVDFVERGVQGLGAIFSIKGVLVSLALSMMFWVVNALSFYFLAIGCPEMDLTFVDICGMMVIICFFIALPSVPGFWGLWEAAGVLALSFHGVSNEAAAGYTLYSHAFSIFPVIIAGWFSCVVLGFRWRRVSP